MSITDELREYTKHYSVAGSKKDTMLSSIADRIDEEHDQMHDFCERLENAVTDREDVTLWGVDYTALPIDADGEYIHIGDRVENNERVVRIVLTDGSWEPSVYLEIAPNVIQEYFCNEVSHYHKPTVEDMLTEFGIDWEHESDCEDRAALLKEYAAKLQLREDA